MSGAPGLAEPVDAPLGPGRRDELHRAERPGAGRAVVGAVTALDLADRRQHRPGHARAVHLGGRLVQGHVAARHAGGRHVGGHRELAHGHDGNQVDHLGPPADDRLDLGHQRDQIHTGGVDQHGEVLGQAELRRPGLVHDRVRAGHAERGLRAERHLDLDRSRHRIGLPGRQVQLAGRGAGADQLPLAQVGPDRVRRRGLGRSPGPERLRRHAEHVDALAVDRDLAAVDGQHGPHPGQLADLGQLRGADPGGRRGDQVRHEELPWRRAGRAGSLQGLRYRPAGRGDAGRGVHGEAEGITVRTCAGACRSGEARQHRARRGGDDGQLCGTPPGTGDGGAAQGQKQHNVQDDIRPRTPTESPPANC